MNKLTGNFCHSNKTHNYKKSSSFLSYLSKTIRRADNWSRGFKKPGRALIGLLWIALFSASPKLVMAGTCGSSSPAAPVSDDFTAASLNTGLWTAAAPAGGSANVSNGHLVLAVPGGSNHDPSAGGINNSIRAMQTISNADFDIAVKFDAAVNLAQYEGEGILVQQDSSNYIRFDYYSDGSARYLNATSMAQGVGATRLSMVVPGGQPYWMQVQRSGNTWTLSGSTDGTHYTSAGSFTLAMTVAQAGPFAWNYSFNPSTAPSFTASVDYFYNLAAVVPPTCGPSAPVSDDFTASSLNTALWTASAPAGGSAALSNNHLLLAVPGGKNHDPSVGGVNNSVRAMQTIANADFSVAAKFDSVVNVVPYQGEGIFVQQDSSNYIRFQLYSNGTGRYLSASSMLSGTTGATQLFLAVPNAGAPYWISVKRAGNVWTLSGSTDGTHYTSAGSFTLPLTVAQMGPFAWNWNATPANSQAFTASVDYFYNMASPGTGDGGDSTGSPNVSISPTSLPFGSIQVGTASPSGTATLSNTGTAALSINSVSITGADPADFVQTNNCGSSLNTGSSCTLKVIFDPMATGVRSASISIATNASGSPASVSLSGTGTTATTTSTATYSTPDYIYPADGGYYNVKNYGAKGDGTTDDTAAIQSAMKAALYATDPFGDNIHGGTVYFPAGTYVVSQPLLWATYGNNDAQLTANVDASRGCITGINIVNGGSGYRNGFFGWHGESNQGPGLLLTGGGGGGAELYTDISNGSVINIQTSLGNVSTSSGCLGGHGYTSAPKVTVLNWHAYFRFEGQNKANTKIKLSNNNPQFQNANCNVSPHGDSQAREWCQAMLITASEEATGSTGFGEDAYQDDIWNLTIDTGSGNPGAVGIDWVASNRGSIKNVNIISGDNKGRAGLSVARSSSAGSGPAYGKNISISGFDYGIYGQAAATEVGTTFEYINFSNINVAGVVNGLMPNWFREVTANISVPVFINQNGGSLAVIDGNFTGGASNNTAIQFPAMSSNGVLFLRNITTSGYQAALSTGSGNTVTAGSGVTEFAYPAPLSLFPGDVQTSLNLRNIPNTPEYIDGNMNDWVNPKSYNSQCGHSFEVDSTACVQAAMNSGKPIVYLPWGLYNFTSPIDVPSTVRVIEGMNSEIMNNGDTSRASYPTFRFDGTGTNPVELRNLGFYITDQGNSVQQNGSQPLVMADLLNGVNVNNTSSGTGDLYIENVAFPQGTFNLAANQHMYARQYDVETSGNNVTINGGTVWMFGYKSEGSRPGSLWNISNSTFELIGAFSSTHGDPSPAAAFTFNNSSFSLAGVSTYDGWANAVSDTKNGTTLTAPINFAWVGGIGYGLFSGHN